MEKEDRRKNNGGNKNAGRKSKSDEAKALSLIKKALKKLYNEEEDDDNTIMFLHDFAQTPRGQQFIAEHLLGKPKEHVDITSDGDSLKDTAVQISFVKTKDVESED